MKIIIFVHTCKKYENSRAKLLEKTWTKGDNVVFITDNENSELKNHICIGPYETPYTYHPENVKKMFHLFLDKYGDYDFFMIVDDDTYLYIEKLVLFLSFFNEEEPYMIGDFLNWTHILPDHKFGGKYDKWVSGGPGIVFTKSTIKEYIMLWTQHNIPYGNHDVWLHDLFLLSNGFIKRTHCPGFHQYGQDMLFQKYDKYDNRIISVHLNHNMDILLE